MMIWHIYLRRGIVYIPATGQTEAGFYMDIDPVAVTEATLIDSICRELTNVIEQGNPRVVTPTRANFPKPVILKHAKVSSWSTFEKDASLWTVTQKGSSYEITPSRKSATGGWEDDVAGKEQLPLGVEIKDVAMRVAKLVSQSSSQL